MIGRRLVFPSTRCATLHLCAHTQAKIPQSNSLRSLTGSAQQLRAARMHYNTPVCAGKIVAKLIALYGLSDSVRIAVICAHSRRRGRIDPRPVHVFQQIQPHICVH